MTGETIETEHPNKNKERSADIPEDEENGKRDDLFFNAVQIVVEAQQASVTLLQRRLRIGYTRAARLIDKMEESNYVGPYRGSQPREVLIKELSPVLLMLLDEKGNKSERMERNAPKKELERFINTERSEKVKNVPEAGKDPEPEIPDDEGLTPKQRIFIAEYLRDFSATRSAIAAGYSKKTAYQIGFALFISSNVLFISISSLEASRNVGCRMAEAEQEKTFGEYMVEPDTYDRWCSDKKELINY